MPIYVSAVEPSALISYPDPTVIEMWKGSGLKTTPPPTMIL